MAEKKIVPTEEIIERLSGIEAWRFMEVPNNVLIDGKKINMYVFGNDECWEGNEFFHYGLTVDDDNSTLYILYYNVPDGFEVWQIDYNKPESYRTKEIEVFKYDDGDTDWEIN